MKCILIPLLVLSGILSLSAATTSLSPLDLSTMSAGWGEPQRDLSITGKPLRIGEQSYSSGIGKHASPGASNKHATNSFSRNRFTMVR
ncbi:NPCBM/NEW2 domain-containing protein [Novipirellula artificiosorum]|uniref:NPCBM/NEW2 domain protein n=1 Tax=Novipirellula artificiosorum TaxID=2528016 RepID=A0A5C6D6J5_9BACT|nr:NPCBM/NEW2 domain-containing protein [Novipirellula artificiosorum]TWU31321.1 NPCBM/NEW2 domain protein [Novipirellula artificiosorum]